MTRSMAILLLLIAPSLARAALEKTVHTGPVTSVVKLEPEAPVIGDDVTLTLTITSEKGVELIKPEFGQMLEQFAIVDFTTSETFDDQGRSVITQRYQLQSSRSGKLSIPPILIEYVDRRPGEKPAPDDMDAYEHLTERLDFEIKSVLPTDAKAELHPPLGKLEPPPVEKPWWWRGMISIGAGVVVVGLAWWLMSLSRNRVHKRSAFEIAMNRLNELLARPHDSAEQLDRFFVELSAIVRWYLENRFDLRAPELTTEEFLELMARSPDLTREHQELLRDFLRRADLVKFARFVPTTQDIEQSIEAAKRFLEDTRQLDESERAKLEVAHA